MKWIIKKVSYHKIGFGIFSWVFVCVLSCFVFLDTNTYASTITKTWSTGMDSWTVQPIGSTGICGYTYLHVHANGDFGASSVYVQGKPVGQTSNSGYNFGSSITGVVLSDAFYDMSNLSLEANCRISPGNYMGNGRSLTVTLSDSPIFSSPSGSLSITENGTYDVTNYAEVDVNIPETVVYGDYHDDLVSINNSILICGAICLVIYFFYCIYRMIIKSVGGR